MSTWKFKSIIEEDKEFKIDGINIWNHYWHCADRKIEVIGPLSGNPYLFNHYEIRTPEKTISFVVGEFSEGRIGLYLPEEIAINSQ
ncbi:hypothetical protein [Kaistella carnis]|uniref:Uncharacterized protein n=1 Tax=Kaistella carnis TaxID=1241979 RepID=A0A3G8XX55_9FLAO|nr:hypothetical protein [Kaistella carnis]AZI33301.1 hypothetical protein EIB73_08960 [Kaistella carnis]